MSDGVGFMCLFLCYFVLDIKGASGESCEINI